MNSADGLLSKIKNFKHYFLPSKKEKPAPCNRIAHDPEDPEDLEDAEDYRQGGYHQVALGDEFSDGRYRVLRKLGWGHFSTVWLALDRQSGREVALKIVKAEERYREAAEDEIVMLRRVREGSLEAGIDHPHVVIMLDDFRLEGANGTHVCMVFEVLGINLLKLIRIHGLIPPQVVKMITRQILLGLDLLHRQCGIIHTDLKPENILLKGSDNPIENIQVKIADLGNACWIEKHFTDDIQTRQYRSPEVILGLSYDTSTDIWSLACLTYELLTGDYLFQPHHGKRYTKDEDHMALMIEMLGPIPRHLTSSTPNGRDLFNRRGELRNIRNIRLTSLSRELVCRHGWPAEEAYQVEEFLMPMLCYSPKRRATAEELLRHRWLSLE